MDKIVLKEIILEQRQALDKLDTGIERELLSTIKTRLDIPHVVMITGIRRCGKSTLLRQIFRKYYHDNAYFFSFEDERLLHFTAADFNDLYELLMEVFGEKTVFFFDEIQNVPGWENAIRRLQDAGNKFFITGSNASLLSRELGTKLTGRSVALELFPFSFKEFLDYKKHPVHKNTLNLTGERSRIKRHFNEYLRTGGMPEFLKYDDPSLLKRQYEDILYRDIVARHEIQEIKSLRELGLYFISNSASLFSYNKLKNMLQLGSINTAKSYAGFLEDSYLIFIINQFSYAMKQQLLAPKKCYCIDNGIMEAVAFQFSANHGKFLENTVFLQVRRKYNEIYYYKTKNNREVDLLVRHGKKKPELFQVSESLSDKKAREREIFALAEAMDELKVSEAYVLTRDTQEEINLPNKKIIALPVYKWLLSDDGGKNQFA